ncbi:cobalt-zinc-cadmium resistance protein czcA [Micavibrio aeruginosavorus ARL-13]|uniref:Cobalt-zinc-cadmium resistance protein czcA n=2 Tax=Micavibrio aeruginosavorus TaxID=349221 RepID=G2KS14_MICAA|nr:cobalt-zinc-cadmium resistance protein czcA [Micavibrio aeruginosavorus ARL-13]
MMTAVLAAYGMYSLSKLPIDAVPDITNNQVAINIEVPSLSPFEIEQQVTYPIETAMAGIPGLVYTRSISRNGFAQVTVIFKDNVDLYFARAQVNERLAQAKESLPEGAEPRMGAISTGLGEIYMWTVEYEDPNAPYTTPEGRVLQNEFEKAMYLRTVQDWIIRPQLKTVPGVAEVDAIGGYAQQYHVQPDPQKLAALGLSFSDVIEALERNNASTGAGFLEQKGESYVVRADGRLETIEQIGNVVLSTRGGIPLYVKDVANVALGKELRTGSASENGHEVVVGTAMMLKGENSRIVSKAVDAKLAEINRTLPEGVKAKTVLNRTKLVDATIHTVQKNLGEGALLVVVVLFLLLGNFRAALITALVIPIAMMMTATGMLKMGISANLMSLGALDFGLIVDGAVIVTENCLRRLSERQHHEGRLLTLSERMEEVMEASRQMIQPAVFGQAIIITVYLPLLTFSGVEGKMFEPMAMTVIIALVAAFILSITFIPAMIAIFIRGKVEEKENRIIAKAKSAYAPMLNWSLKRPKTVILAALAFFVFSMLVGTRLGQEFIPTLDEKDIAMHAMRIPSTGISESTAMQLQVEKAISVLPEVAFVYAKTGTAEMAADPMPPNVSDTFIILKPKDEWPDKSMTKPEFIEKLAKAVEQVPGNNYEYTQPIQMRFNELIAGVRSDVAIKVYGDDFDVMSATANKIASALRRVNGAADVKVEQVTGLPMLDIDLNKGAIARYGLNIGDILDLVAVAIGGQEAGLIFEGDRRFPIVVRLPEEIRQDIPALENLPVPVPHENGGRGAFVPLKELVSFRLSEGPNQISRENGKRRVVVQANVRGRDIGSFVAEAQDVLNEQVKIPSGYWLDWGGQFENLEAARARLMIVVPACFFLIFMMLFTALGSTKQALLVFSGVPLAISGGILTLFLRDMPFSIPAAVGFIALSGIAVLNGLVMISYINHLVAKGIATSEAIVQGALTRLRPVLMTALVASLGFVPMALATGTGAEVQKPLATVVIGGLVTATLLTLIVLPALYKLFSKKDQAVADEEFLESITH